MDVNYYYAVLWEYSGVAPDVHSSYTRWTSRYPSRCIAGEEECFQEKFQIGSDGLSIDG